MSNAWSFLFRSDAFIPHGHCYLWQTNLVLLHLLSDSIIALAYYSIPITLFYFVYKRKDLPFSWIFLLFSAFIIACGTTHFIAIWTLWYPIYWFSGLVKAFTALVSFITALELVPLVPKALALPSPDQLHAANQELQTQIAERLRVENELRTYQNHLQDLVSLRTQELTNTNQQLQAEITERQRILEALHQSEEQYRVLVETMPQIVWTSNDQGECDFVNKNWIKYTGLTFAASLNKGWLAAVHPEDTPKVHTVWLEAMKSGTLYEDEYRVKRIPDNSYRWQLARGLPIKDEQGRIVKWFGTCTDIHEQKQIQQERDKLLELEQSARTKAETANRIKDEFLAVLSHELRTPLNSILGWSQLLQNHQLDQDKTNQALATIERNAKLQVQLIDDLLDVSRILRGKLVLNTLPMTLESMVLPAIETIRLAAESKSINLRTVLAEDLGQVMGDVTRLQQVFWNLLSNAVKFTPNGGEVLVELAKKDGYAQIFISDTGQGISKDFLPYVFDYFRQADSSSTRKFGGLGLGLAIVKNIVEMHGGTVEAMSPGVNLGATFIVNLPLMKDKSLGSNYQPKESILLSYDSLRLQNLRVLFVDDDADSRDFVAYVLEREGAKVITVASAGETLQVLENSQIDVLISDISMPEMDGYMLMRQIRGWGKTQNLKIPAIALTAYAGEYSQSQAIEAGFQLHLPKPIVAEELVSAIASVIR
ncbi:hybrid sensor histidine kinase/response regulator [Richelia sinica]|uniref:hybrid sensor histidine kinase/response regulator n=1 Tax=Richelia sinica TaxID=1357545 RepID=UPI001685E77E|nr:ATP-binding protein [Richelia sinica]MBD2665014.1 response regulator [Richelia sinica FACHB-800]